MTFDVRCLMEEVRCDRKLVFVTYQNDINEATRAQLDAISTALSELQSKEPHKREHRPIGFIVPDEKKE